MADSPSERLWGGRLIYLALVAVLIFLALLPMHFLPRLVAPPDLMLALTFAWVVRRPDMVPVFLIAAVFLLCDLLFQRPPGLMAGLIVIFTEILRARAKTLRNFAFSTEWITVAFAMIGLTIAYRFALILTLVPVPPLGLTLIQLLLTILVYPLVVGLSYLGFGLHRPAPGAVDRLGHRL